VRILRGWPARRQHRWLPEEGDAALYAASALFAGLTAQFSGIALYAQWGKLAVGPYLAAAVVSALVARHRRHAAPVPVAALVDEGPGDAGRPGRPALHWSRLRIFMFLVVLVGATLVPLGLEVVWASEGNASLHVQPEVSVVQQAAQQLTHGRNPYYLPTRQGHVLPKEPNEPVYESFFPYLPFMTIFGLPSSTKVPVRLGDARIYFTIATLLVTAGALALCRAPSERKIRTLMVLTVLPTAALPLATGGDDMPVVALLLMAMVLAQRRRPGLAGVVLGVVSAMKFTAWPLAALALFAARDRQGRRTPGRMLLGMVVVAGPAVAPFVWRNPHDFVQNVIMFPLGLANVPSPAASPLPGHLLVTAFPHLHRILPVTLAVVGGLILARHLVRHPPSTTGQVCTLAGWIMTAAILLAPATRIGYLLYPINFFVWGWLLGGADEMAELPPAEHDDRGDELSVGAGDAGAGAAGLTG